MRTICILIALCTFGCSQITPPLSTEIDTVQAVPTETMDNLVYIDMFAPKYTAQHPLIGRSKGGQDMIFRHPQSEKTIHAVFPKNVSVPKDLKGSFVLHGHYQVFKNNREKKGDGCLIKKIPENYSYFVVSSWKHQE